MEEKKFSKFFVASLKRTAQNVYPLVRQRNKLQKQIEEAMEEFNSINVQLDAYQAPIKEQTGGYTTDDLISREVIDTGKTDKNGKPVSRLFISLSILIPLFLILHLLMKNLRLILMKLLIWQNLRMRVLNKHSLSTFCYI